VNRAVVLHLLNEYEESPLRISTGGNLIPGNPYRDTAGEPLQRSDCDLAGAIEIMKKQSILRPRGCPWPTKQRIGRRKNRLYQARFKKEFWEESRWPSRLQSFPSKTRSTEKSEASLLLNKGIPNNRDMSLRSFWKIFKSIFTDSKNRSECL